MLEKVAIKRTDKPWGYELLIARTNQYVGKILHVNPGQSLSLQNHVEKDETIHLFKGEAVMHYHDEQGKLNKLVMLPGVSFHIPPNTVHRLEAVSDCDFFEVSTTQLDDVVRLEDAYGRQGTSAP